MAFSDQIFLIEYALHMQLLNKLKLAGKNALFCYRTSIKVNSTSITGLATGTAVCLQALPLPKPVKILASAYLEDDSDVGEFSSFEQSDMMSSSNSKLFQVIESLSRYNIRRILEQPIVSLQSPYTYVKDLPKKRVIENLMTVAELQAPGVPSSG